MGQDEHGVTEIPFELTRYLPLAGALRGDRQDLVARLKDGESLWLDRELYNSHDKNAIAVYSEAGQAGYIRKSDAKMLAPLMDAGERVAAHVVETRVYETGSGPALGVSIALDFGEAADKNDVEPEKPSRAERMIAAGEKMENIGKATSSAGCGITGFVFSAVALVVILWLLWAVAC